MPRLPLVQPLSSDLTPFYAVFRGGLRLNISGMTIVRLGLVWEKKKFRIVNLWRESARRTHIDREVEQISEMRPPLFTDLDGESATLLHTHDATHDRDLRP